VLTLTYSIHVLTMLFIRFLAVVISSASVTLAITNITITPPSGPVVGLEPGGSVPAGVNLLVSVLQEDKFSISEVRVLSFIHAARKNISWSSI
jgi:hypothetical protein